MEIPQQKTGTSCEKVVNHAVHSQNMKDFSGNNKLGEPHIEFSSHGFSFGENYWANFLEATVGRV